MPWLKGKKKKQQTHTQKAHKRNTAHKKKRTIFYLDFFYIFGLVSIFAQAYPSPFFNYLFFLFMLMLRTLPWTLDCPLIFLLLVFVWGILAHPFLVFIPAPPKMGAGFNTPPLLGSLSNKKRVALKKRLLNFIPLN